MVSRRLSEKLNPGAPYLFLAITAGTVYLWEPFFIGLHVELCQPLLIKESGQNPLAGMRAVCRGIVCSYSDLKAAMHVKSL